MMRVHAQKKHGLGQNGTCRYSDSGAGIRSLFDARAAAVQPAAPKPEWKRFALGYDV